MSNITKADIEYLFTPPAIRATTKKIYDLCLSGKTNFELHLDKMEACSELVMKTTYDNYPDLDIPFHSRWGHFKIGGIDREQVLNDKISSEDKLEQARTKLDLVITSVLLDAGAGPTWKFNEDGRDFNRSEGLAVASYHLFMSGVFANDKGLRADGEKLKSFSSADLLAGFQVTEKNPLVGVDGRVALISKLGDIVCKKKEFFPKGRPGSIVDHLIAKHGNKFEVGDILQAVLYGFGDIWPSRINVEDTNLGDIWHYAPLGELGNESVVCFHKLSQWLTYSLVTPMIEAGLEVTGAEKLTGLAEYRNGGLFVDSGVLTLRNPELIKESHLPSSELIIEWRALTVQLLDQMGDLVQKKLGKSPSEFPLAKVLEGGTWWAGRILAKQNRADSSTPIKLNSDGTVF